MSDELLNRTPLYGWHKSHGAKIVDFAGWLMPLQYEEGIKAEHLFTREVASLFDVSHMGEIRFKGDESLQALSFLVPSDIDSLKKGEAQYSFFPNAVGGVVDDLIIYCVEEGKDYLVCVNASNTEKAFNHAKIQTCAFDFTLTDESLEWSQMALQGPKAMQMCESVFKGSTLLKKFGFAFYNSDSGIEAMVARTGYTGEDGVEVFVHPEKAVALWEEFLEKGARPCGLAARDSLRLEAALNLYGNELSETCNPFECRMGWTVSKTKKSYLGCEPLMNYKKSATRKIVGLKSLERAIPRQGYAVYDSAGEEVIGEVTSGTLSPVLSYPVAMVSIDKKAVERDKNVKVKVRDKFITAEIVSLPFIKKI